MKKGRETNQEIMTKFSLNSNANINTSIKATMYGNAWEPREDPGGRRSFLSDVDTVIFENKISHSCFDLQCLSTKHAMQIIMDLKEERYNRAKFIANLRCQNASMTINYQRIINELYPTFPSDSWLTNFCNSNDIFLKSPDTLENVRSITVISKQLETSSMLIAIC